MAYRYDEDLEFLGKLKSEDLNDLVRLLTHDKDGSERITEELTKTNRYKRYHPEHHKYWEEIAAEIQCFGANSVATMIRGGKGVLYREVLTDVCSKLKVPYNKQDSTAGIETNILLKILNDSFDKMSDEEKVELAKSVGIDSITDLTPQAKLAAFQAVFRMGGFKSYQLTVVIVNAVMKQLVGRGLPLAANAALLRAMSILTGPVGWVITGVWTAVDIAGPAYRVTIPAVMEIIFLRSKYQNNQ